MPFANSGSARIYFEVAGDGEAVLLIPGLGGNTKQMAAISTALAETHHVITVDPRGAGQSDKPNIPYTGEILVEDMIAVLDASEIERTAVIGISMGGMIGQELAIRHPERVRMLMLSVTYAANDPWSERMWEVRQTAIERLGIGAQFRLAQMFLFSPRTFRSESEAIEDFAAGFDENPPDEAAYRRQMEFCKNHDARSRLSEISVPTLVVSAADDITASPLQGRELAQGIPSARFMEIADAPHLFMLAQPEKFAGIFTEFDATESGETRPVNRLSKMQTRADEAL